MAVPEVKVSDEVGGCKLMAPMEEMRPNREHDWIKDGLDEVEFSWELARGGVESFAATTHALIEYRMGEEAWQPLGGIARCNGTAKQASMRSLSGAI